MAICIQTEEIISLTQAARELPSLRNNRPVAPPTIWRWANYGVKAGGQIIKLEMTSLAGRTVTSRQAVQRFLEQCAAARSGKPIPEQSSRTQQQMEASRILSEAGI